MGFPKQHTAFCGDGGYKQAILFYSSFWKNDSCSGNRGLFVFLLIFALKHWGIVHLISQNANEATDLIYEYSSP